MGIRIGLVLLLTLFISNSYAQGNTDWYDGAETNKDNVGILGGLAINSTAGLIDKGPGWSHTMKGALGIVPTLGFYYQKGIGDRLSIRASLSIGRSSNNFKYAQNFDSLSENYTPLLSTKFDKYTSMSHGTSFILPQIDLGYIFGPFKNVYLLEVRAGVAFHIYTGKGEDTIRQSKFVGVTDPKKTYTYESYTTEQATYGSNRYGSIIGNLYFGVKWQKTTSDLLNRMSMGIQITMPVSTSDVGFATVEYKNQNYETFTSEKLLFSLANVGIRVNYHFLK
jgi:hypothetical protein